MVLYVHARLQVWVYGYIHPVAPVALVVRTRYRVLVLVVVVPSNTARVDFVSSNHTSTSDDFFIYFRKTRKGMKTAYSVGGRISTLFFIIVVGGRNGWSLLLIINSDKNEGTFVRTYSGDGGGGALLCDPRIWVTTIINNNNTRYFIRGTYSI